MNFLEYLKKLDRLDEIETKLRNPNVRYSCKIDMILGRINKLREKYEIAIIEQGDYPRV